MITLDYPKQEVCKKTLPQLIKKSSTYKLIVPRKVEEKIRYLLRKFPTTEWSGVLFTTHEGTFENGDLVITCQDIYPMDLGNSTFTQFKMSEDVAGYMAENMELFECDCQLIHSHHTMSTFFSGTDINTLQEEGNERNCFVSLIVNNAGTYNAAITRKIQTKTEVVTKSLGTSYEFFGDGEIRTEEDPMTEVTEIVDKEVIEYFMLEVEREEVDNPLDYLDTRFKEIEQRKAAATVKVNSPFIINTKSSDDIGKDNNYGQHLTFFEPTLWDKETMKEMEVQDGFIPSPEIIHKMITKLVTCSLLIEDTKIDLEGWVTKFMARKYQEFFSSPAVAFQDWAEFATEFLLNYTDIPDVPASVIDDWDKYQETLAEAMIDALGELPANEYIDVYIEVLNRYL